MRRTVRPQADSKSSLRIGAFAAAAAVAPSLVRYYEAQGVLPQAERVSGARSYDARALDRLRGALVARRLGLTLAQTRAALDDARSLAAIARERVDEVEAEIRLLRVKRALLRHAARTGTLSVERFARVLARIES